MKRKSLLIMLLVALFVPLAMNAQTKSLKRSGNGSTQLEMRVSPKAMPSNPMLSKLESAKEAALEELNNRAGNRGTYSFSNIPTSGWSTNGGTKTINGIDWTYSSSTYIGVTGGAIQIGSRNSPQTSAWTIQTPVSSFGQNVIVTGVSITGYTTRTTATYSISVNGTTVKNGNLTTSSATYSATNLNYTSGNIVVTMTGSNNSRAMYLSNITVTYEDAGCSAPENFAASNVTTNSATLSWTETGTSDTWVVYYMAEDDEESSYEIVDTNPYTLTGLNPLTTYYALVTPYCGDLDQDSEVITFTTADLPCPKPTDLSVSDITMSSATVSWSGEADSYTLQYRIPASNGEAALFQDFESGDFGEWTTVRNGGGTTNTDWRVINPNEAFSSSPGDAHSGDYLAMSRSWASSAYSVDNWLISPQFTLGGTLKYWVMDDGEYHETYYICVSTTGNSVSNFTQIYAPGNATDSWTEVSVDLSAYEGMTGYIAFRHTDRDQDYLFIDDIGVYGESQPAGPWVTVNNVTSPYTITGLQGETTYEWQIQGDCGADGTSLVAYGENFTTASACDAPVALTATNVTNSSATISWAGNTDTYNIQYGAVDPDAPVTVILTADDVWGDGSGYQMLLDADATAYGTTIPATGPLTTSGDASNAVYAEFEYKIPVRADGALTTTNIVSNGASVSIEIPAGTYDWCITNPTPGDRMWIAADAGNVGGRQDDYVFEPGKTYEFHVYLSGTGDATDVTITSNAEMTVVNNVTNPYTLTNLTMNTTYEVQVQGVNCDGNGNTTDWSASTTFTTLNGILVSSIAADDVTVTIGTTASITNLVVLPAEATNPAVTYASNDETIATVDADGVVTGVTVGTTTITIAATDGSNVTTTINVTVNGIDVTEITAEDVTVVNGETATISYTVAPNNATDQSVTFNSADVTIATVDADGVVTGVNPGETTITIASVSNPEVTATINVTVTSNPNAVQFTVNAPANAAPGDVITVEGVLAAPTSGTWNGFTGLILDITYDNTAFEYVANSQVYGPVATQAQQNGAFMQSGTLANAVQLGMIISDNNNSVSTEGVVFSAQFTVLAETGEYTFTAEPHEGNLSYDVELLPYEATPSTVEVGVPEQHERDILAWTDKGGFYLIATPIGEVAPTAVTNMIPDNEEDYDLYYFDQVTDGNNNEWINYKGDPTNPMGNFSLVPGKGYLYANKNDVTLIFTGSCPFTEDTYTITLTKDGSSPSFAGWNLVGNPFAQTAWVDTDHNAYYTMNEAGTAFIGVTSNSIEAMEGIFVRANSNGEEISFTTIDPNAKCSSLALNLSQGNGLMDRATVRFDEGCQLPKLQFNRNSSKVYIPMDSEDYAVVRGEEIGEMPVNFKAESNGTYNLSLSTDNVEFAYLHLIDNLTGNDVDLLQTPSYSFEAKTTDYESRFKLVFATGNNGNDDNFAFFSNGSFVINNEGEATLQVIDVTGRVLKSETINGCANVSVNGAAGVYMLRLINGDNMKVQKVVVK